MAERKPIVLDAAGMQMELPFGDTLPLSALPASLANFGGLAGSANQVPYFTGPESYALTFWTGPASAVGYTSTASLDNNDIAAVGTVRGMLSSRSTAVGDADWDLTVQAGVADRLMNPTDANGPGFGSFAFCRTTPYSTVDGTTSMCQEAIQYNGGAQHRYARRHRQGTTWSPWVEEWNSGNFNPTLKADVTYVDNQIATRVELRVSGERIRLPSAGSTGNYISFYGESGRRGYIGFGSGANDILTILSDTAAIRLMYAGAQRLITTDAGISVSGQITLATPATGDNSTRAPTTAWTNAAIAAAIAAAPAAAIDYTQMAKSGSAGPNGFLRTAQGATYSFVPLWEEAKALAGDRYIGQMRCVSSGTTGAGTSAAIGTDYITMVTGSSASGGCAVYVDEGSYSIQRVFKPYPDSPVTNIKNLWFNGVFRMPSALSSASQRYTLDMGINGNYGSVTNGGITIRYSDNLNSGRPVVIYQNAAGSTVTTNTTLSVAANDVIQVALAITRDASNVATVGILIANLTQGQIVNVSLTGTQTIYNSAAAFPPNVAQAKMQFSIQKSIGTTSISAQLLGMTTGFNWITPLADWQ